MPEADPGDLMARAQRGDRSAFDELVRAHHRAVFSYARRVLGDDDRAGEVAQDTFVRAWRYRDSCDPASGTVRAWLFAIAANRVRDARKARGEQPAGDDLPEVAAGGEAGLDAFARGAMRDEVSRAVDALPPDQREVVALKYLSDLSYEDVARILGVSVSAAKMRALRARDALARALARLMASDSGDGPR
jgi:RNA polymerase sigma-70 factor (ECF subfamily)